jgi:hypothetical protein
MGLGCPSPGLVLNLGCRLGFWLPRYSPDMAACLNGWFLFPSHLGHPRLMATMHSSDFSSLFLASDVRISPIVMDLYRPRSVPLIALSSTAVRGYLLSSSATMPVPELTGVSRTCQSHPHRISVPAASLPPPSHTPPNTCVITDVDHSVGLGLHSLALLTQRRRIPRLRRPSAIPGDLDREGMRRGG